jgi:hypothetical protein
MRRLYPIDGILPWALTAGCPAGEAVADANGIAHLRIADRSAGWFVAERKDPETKRTIRGETSYDLASGEDASREFTLRLAGGLQDGKRMESTKDE